MDPGLISHQNFFNSNHIKLSSRKTKIFHLNYDCLSELFRYLDLASQFAILQTHPSFLDVVLSHLWYPYYEKTFNFSQDPGVFQRPMEFQCHFLEVVLQRFPRVTQIPSDIFKLTMELTENVMFENVLELTIDNYSQTASFVDFQDFSRFPKLQKLCLENCIISFRDSQLLKSVQSFSLVSSHIAKNGQQMNPVFSVNLNFMDFTPISLHFINFQFISKCVNLKYLTIYCHSLRDSKCLNCILHLPALKNLTLYSFGNLYFTPKNLKLFKGILSQNRRNPLESLEIYGIPDRWFFKDPNLKQLVTFNWALDKIFHKRADGCLEWCCNLKETVQDFYEFVVSSANLKTLHIRNNVLHSKRRGEERNIEEKLQIERKKRGNGQLDVVQPTKGVEEEHLRGDVVKGHSDAFRQSILKLLQEVTEVSSHSVNMSKGNTPSCNMDPSKHHRQQQADQCRQPTNIPKECLGNTNPGKRPFYSLPQERSCSPSGLKGRPLNVAMEVEKDKCTTVGHNRAPVYTNCDRYRSNSAEGRPFDRNVDLTYNRPPNTFSPSPPQLKGRSLHIPMEVERGRRLAEAQRRRSPPAKNEGQSYSQYFRRLSDSTPTNKSYNYGTPSAKGERSIGSARPATKFQTPRTINTPEPKSDHWPSRPIHSSPIRHNASYPPTGGNTITRTTVTTTTTRSVPPQNSRYFPNSSLLEQREQPKKSSDVDIVRQQNQIPTTKIAPQSLLRTPQQPLSASSLVSHSASYPENVSQNTIQCPIEFEEAELESSATIEVPTAESARYEDTDDQKRSRGVVDTSQRAPEQTYKSMMSAQRQPVYPQSFFIDCTRDDTIGPMAVEEPCTEETPPPQKYSVSKSKRTTRSPSDLSYGAHENRVQSPPTFSNASVLRSTNCPPNATLEVIDQTLPPSRSPLPPQAVQYPQSTLIDFTRDDTIGPMAAEDPCTEENLPPQKYSVSKSKRTASSPSDLGYEAHESRVQSPPTFSNASVLRSTNCPPNTSSLAYEAGPTDPQPTAVCPPCPQDTPIAALFRCLANMFSSTFDYLSSFVTSQKPLDASAARNETSSNYGSSRQSGIWETYGRPLYPMTQLQQQCIWDTTENDNLTQFLPNQLNKSYNYSSRQPLSSSRRHDVPQSVRECAEAKRCGHVQYDTSDKYEVQNTQLNQMRRTQMENLVLDTYCPGIIQETIDGLEDFNCASLNITTQLDDNCHEPMTLLEAFALRIDKERSDLNQKLQEDATEIIINETVNNHFASAYPSELNRSIRSLLLSEHMAEHNQIEAAKTSEFKANVEKKVLKLELLDVPFKLVAYIGQTTPSE